MKKSLSSLQKVFILVFAVAAIIGAGYTYNTVTAEDFVGTVTKKTQDYSDIEKYLSDTGSDIKKVTGFSFTASNNTGYAVFGGAVRFGVMIFGTDEAGNETFMLSNDVKVQEAGGLEIIRDYLVIIPDTGVDERDISIDVKFLERSHTFSYKVLMQEVSNTNTSILVTPYMGVGSSFEPYDTETVGGRSVSVQAADDLQELFDAAEDDGYDIWVNSGYRSYSLQQSLYNNAVRQLGEDQNDTAKPGHSEHHTGYAADLTWTIREGYISDRQANDDEYFWMLENGYKYGFILRYPKGSEDITGYIFEPWHFRYIGKELAKQYHEEGWQTLEEFLCIPRWNIE